jgi:hypothetical protein
MGRLPKEITTNVSPKLTPKIWFWILVGIVFVGAYACYNVYKFQPVEFFEKPTVTLKEPVDSMEQMKAPTTQDLQALPIAQETAEEAIGIVDFKNDELVQIFEEQEQKATKTDLKPKAPLVMKRSLGLV